jgi:hypothetical protein
LFIFEEGGKTWGFAGENEGKIFDRGATGDAKIEIFRGGKTRENEGLRKTT